jgi:hypothetical protein
VHIHDCFDIQRFLDAAASNFAFHSSPHAAVTPHRYVLCLTETYSANKFTSISRTADSGLTKTATREASWIFVHSSDEKCLIAAHPIHGEIAIVAGRQIVTAERLEILALGSVEKWDDGLEASDVVQSVRDAGAIPVLPWGFGKWLGRRKRTVEDLMSKFGDGLLYLGDNSGRPRILPNPRQFAAGRELGIRILPGSDPLPFASEYDRAGSFGFYLDGVSEHDGVWAGLCAALEQPGLELHSYGFLESPLRFLRNQIAMQYVTRVTSLWRSA